jgi:hypothetical protein
MADLSPARRTFAFGAAIAAAAALLILGCWRWKGDVGLAGSAVGAGLGTAIALVGLLLRRRARAARGTRIVPAMLASIVATFVLFLAVALGVALTAKAAAAPVLLAALGVYLAASFADAFRGE